MSGLGRVARGAMVKCWLWRAGSRRLSRPKAEATGLAPKQAADRHYPLASPSEGFVLVSSPILAGCAGSRSSSSEGSVLAPSPIPAGRAVSCQQVPAMASRAHPLRLTLRSSAVFPFGLLTAAGAFVRMKRVVSEAPGGQGFSGGAAETGERAFSIQPVEPSRAAGL